MGVAPWVVLVPADRRPRLDIGGMALCLTTETFGGIHRHAAACVSNHAAGL
jgi:hypothetical protein